MISYVLLVVIAVGLSILVYQFLVVFVRPGGAAVCKEDVSLSLDNYDCSIADGQGSLSLTITNKGLFNVSAAYVRIAKDDRKVKSLINGEDVYFQGTGKKPLPPGASINAFYNVTNYITLTAPANYSLEIEPALRDDKGKLALCNQAVITQNIYCD